MNYLPGLALNCDPPDLCLLSSQDYRCEPLVPGPSLLLNLRILPLAISSDVLSWATNP
jgi:hypothetical protein